MIILYGGTFDPLHIGHLVVANEVHAAFQARPVYFYAGRAQSVEITACCCDRRGETEDADPWHR